MSHLSEKTEGYKDSKGKFHDNEEKANRASGQYLIDQANAGGVLSLQALTNVYAQHPELWDMVVKDVDARKDEIRKLAQDQVGTVEPQPQAKRNTESRKP